MRVDESLLHREHRALPLPARHNVEFSVGQFDQLSGVMSGMVPLPVAPGDRLWTPFGVPNQPSSLTGRRRVAFKSLSIFVRYIQVW